MTYKELLEKLQTFSEDELNQTATVYCPNMEEFYPVEAVAVVGPEQDQLDNGHIILDLSGK